jgi:uncharacterized OsmC-like protein
MSEKIILRQNKQYEVGFWYTDPNQPDNEDFQPVQGLYEVTPYGMMLFSLAGCTAQVLLSYASYHNISLDEVIIRADYERNYKDDCDDCENINEFDEKIIERIVLQGNLDERTRKKLFQIAHQCPIDKMFRSGIAIDSNLTEEISIQGME